MRQLGVRRASFGIAIVLFVALLVTTAVLVTRTQVQAQAATDFTLTVSDSTVTADSGAFDIVVGIEPGSSAVAAIGATVAYDETALQAESCVALVGLGACSFATDGVVVVQTVDPNGWDTDTELFRISFEPIAVVDPVPLVATVNEAYDGSGLLIAGSVDNGTVDFQLNGDVNCDGRLNLADALILAQYSVRSRQPADCPIVLTSEIDLTTADVTGDGVVNLADALRTAQCSVGAFDCQE